MATIDVPTTIVMPGSDTGGKAILSVVEAKILPTLRASSNLFAFRATATAANLHYIEGVGQAWYRYVERIVHGTTFDPISGAPLQRAGQKRTRVDLDQQLTLKWMPDQRDMLRLRSSNPDVRAALYDGWAQTANENLYDNWDAMLFQAVKDYCLAFGQFIVLDMSNLTSDQAKDAYFTINAAVLDIMNHIDETQIGTSRDNIMGALSLLAASQLSKGMVAFIDSVGANVLSDGGNYKNSILGTVFEENFFLDKKFTHSTNTELNKDIDYDTTGVEAVFLHKEAFAFPVSFVNNNLVIDNDTGFPKYMDLSMFALPTGIRGWLSFIIVKTTPTAEEITAAKERVGKTFNKELFREFPTIPTVLERNKSYQQHIIDASKLKETDSMVNEMKKLNKNFNKFLSSDKINEEEKGSTEPIEEEKGV